jgi:DNA-binding IclR family transcriptional regulator
VPVHATAVGKLYLAFAPQQVALPSGALPRFTPRTLANRRALEKAVDAARAQGFAENRDEWIPGMAVLAAPILARGELRGALVVAAPSARMDELGRAPTARRMRAAAARIGARLEGRAREEAR